LQYFYHIHKLENLNYNNHFKRVKRVSDIKA
jgi:hypothetical protein